MATRTRTTWKKEEIEQVREETALFEEKAQTYAHIPWLRKYYMDLFKVSTPLLRQFHDIEARERLRDLEEKTKKKKRKKKKLLNLLFFQ